MTTMVSPDEFREDLDKVLTYVSKYKKPKGEFKASLYYNVNMDEDKGKAKEESADFLQKYYREDPSGILDLWVAFGNRADVSKKLEAYIAAGVQDFNIRFVAWDQITQLKKFSTEGTALFQLGTRKFGTPVRDTGMTLLYQWASS